MPIFIVGSGAADVVVDCNTGTVDVGEVADDDVGTTEVLVVVSVVVVALEEHPLSNGSETNESKSKKIPVTHRIRFT